MSDDQKNVQEPPSSSMHTSDNEETLKLDPMPDFTAEDYKAFSERVLADEETWISARREELNIKRRKDSGRMADGSYAIGGLVGLALSGGGIRSATFSIGVMQALAAHGLMKHIDILSTVSGGGYAGSALSWWCSKHVHKHSGNVDDAFPFAAVNESGKLPEPDQQDDLKGWHLMRFLREHGDYLTKGRSIGLFMGLAIVIRGIALNLAVWLPLFIVLASVAYTFELPQRIVPFIEEYWPWVALFLIVLFLGYSLSTYRNSQSESIYQTRRKFEYYTGVILLILILAGIYFGIERIINSDYLREFAEIVDFLTGRFGQAGWTLALIGLIIGFRSFTNPGPLAAPTRMVAFGALMLGVFVGVFQLGRDLEHLVRELLQPLPWLSSFLFVQGDGTAADQTAVPPVFQILSTLGVWITLAAGVMFYLYGTRKHSRRQVRFALGSSVLILLIIIGTVWLTYTVGVPCVGHNLALIWAALAGFSLVFGVYVNINYISLHRFYRDRLMETFMPDPSAVKENKATSFARIADVARLSSFKTSQAPYHIINTNAILVNSENKKFRLRKGDNFMLSPLYCGGNAVGWQKTKEYMADRLTMATAVAISGAAANPNANVGGEKGLTTSPLGGFLMSLLNIRLGNWVPNPKLPALYQGLLKPNHFLPSGFYELCKLFGIKKGFREESLFIEISDGGHFENTAMYELFRRRARLIICCDGGADPHFTFSDLNTCLDRVSEDFGVKISLPNGGLNSIVPSVKQPFPANALTTEKPYLVCGITYSNGDTGTLVFIKTALVEGLSLSTLSYRSNEPEFPDESTIDQFFSPMQFDAYRELGFAIGDLVLSDKKLIDDGSLEDFIGTI